MMSGMTVDMALDYLAISNDALEAQNDAASINLHITDTDEKFFVERKNGVIIVRKDETHPEADTTVSCTKAQFLNVFIAKNFDTKIGGDMNVVKKLLAHCKMFLPNFNVVEP